MEGYVCTNLVGVGESLSRGDTAMIETRISCECQRYFVESKEVNKKGNKLMFPIEVRKMHIRGDFLFTEYYQVTLIKRKGERFYCVKQRKKPVRAWWNKEPIKESEYNWVKEGTYNREGFIQFLKGCRVARPEGMIVEMETCPPDNIAA